jgi:hypothetical protein
MPVIAGATGLTMLGLGFADRRSILTRGRLLAQSSRCSGCISRVIVAVGGRSATGRGATAEDGCRVCPRCARLQDVGFIFDGTMEGDLTAFRRSGIHESLAAGGGCHEKTPTLRLHHPMIVKTHEIAPRPEARRRAIAKQPTSARESCRRRRARTR